MMTKKGLAHAELESLFWNWANAAPQEYRDLEAFFTNHPDIAGVPLPTITLLKAAFDNRAASHVKLKLKTERATAAAQAAGLKDLGLDPQPTAKPPLAVFEELLHILRHDPNCPRNKELCQMIVDLGPDWDYDRGPRWQPDEDRFFIEDLATNDSISEDSILFSPKQVQKVRAIGADFRKWLTSKNAKMEKSNGGA